MSAKPEEFFCDDTTEGKNPKDYQAENSQCLNMKITFEHCRKRNLKQNMYACTYS